MQSETWTIATRTQDASLLGLESRRTHAISIPLARTGPAASSLVRYAMSALAASKCLARD
ncbi:MAG: hypothetical protein DWI58_04055 [Chloroflexi bacterium]|nr:MAG: hypothetical protein DWI58_04055 [Chloroflexota bacterium]